MNRTYEIRILIIDKENKVSRQIGIRKFDSYLAALEISRVLASELHNITSRQKIITTKCPTCKNQVSLVLIY